MNLFPASLPKRVLRPYQVEAIENLRLSLRSGFKRPVLMLPTGGGKTAISGEIIRMAWEKGHKALFVCPAISLIDQTCDSFERDGIHAGSIGVMQANHYRTDPNAPVQVATVQTLARREKPDVDLIIVDEVHVQSKALLDWIKTLNVPVIGLTATPFSKGMGKHWDHLIIASTTAEMIREGYLSDFRVYAPSTPDLSRVKVTAGDYNEGQLSEVMRETGLVADVVSTWIDKGPGSNTLVFCVDRNHAKVVQKQFQNAGISCGYIDAFTDREERREIERKFHLREYRVVVNIGTLIVGVDWIVRCICFCRPTKSQSLYVQAIGRGLRPEYAPGMPVGTAQERLAAIAAGPKADGCMILDHSNTTLSLGFVTDIVCTGLDDGKKAEKAPSKTREKLPKPCPICSYLKPPGVRLCPQCGHTQEAPPIIEHDPGELVEVRGKGKSDIPANCVMIAGINLLKGDFYGQLRKFSMERGYKPGWADRKFRDATGTWPNHYKDSAPREVSEIVNSWVIAQQKKWHLMNKIMGKRNASSLVPRQR